jgi:TolA-binding protein
MTVHAGSCSLRISARVLARGIAAVVFTAATLLPLDSPVAAQKPTIQRTPSGSRGGAGGGIRSRVGQSRGSGGLRSYARPPSRGPEAIRGSIGGGASTLAPGFPLRGRGEGVVAAPFGSSRGFHPRTGSSIRGLPRGAASSVQPGYGAVTGDHRKGYLRSHSRGSGDRHDDHRRRHHRRFFHDGHDTFIIVDPYYPSAFFDPFWRHPYRYGHRYRYGFGCGFYDRYFPGWHGRSAFTPCYSSFNLYLGWPWLVDPWPGFWGFGYLNDYAYGPGAYSRGYASGHSLGYRTGGGAAGGVVQDYSREYQDDGADYEADYDVEQYRTGYGPDADGAPSGSYTEGRRLMEQGDYASALTAFEEYARLVPSDPVAHLARGLALIALGHYGKAAHAFRAGVDAFPAGERVLVDAPAYFGSRAEFRRVNRDLEAYVRRHADSRDARFALGVLYLMAGERDAARSLLRALRGDPHALTLQAGL